MDSKFEKAIEAFDAYHSQDPNRETVGGQSYPAELIYAQRMSNRLNSYEPGASEPIRLAARCQHIGRWEIPRDSYPKDRKGYLQWRNTLKQHHAERAEEILLECGYHQETIDQVKFLVLKKQLFTHPDTQTLEDVVCLVFIEHYLEEFATKHDSSKVIDILQKTMKKMSPKAIAEASTIPLSDHLKPLVSAAMTS